MDKPVGGGIHFSAISQLILGVRLIDLRPLWCLFIGMMFLAAGCRLPNLEAPQCTESRDAVKRFYSFHFGSDMSSTPENLISRKAFLTPELNHELAASNETVRDYFTATENYPKAFRVGECSSDSAEKTMFQVLLLWRDDTRSDQKEVFVETLKVGDKWLINKVSN
ncbi:MAG: hypothetical protein ABIV48_07115 [Pyrinomonadaceae bacterium]